LPFICCLISSGFFNKYLSAARHRAVFVSTNYYLLYLKKCNRPLVNNC
jgi:hypothetical protein